MGNQEHRLHRLLMAYAHPKLRRSRWLPALGAAREECCRFGEGVVVLVRGLMWKLTLLEVDLLSLSYQVGT